jgi:hypothetical protein
MPLATSNDLFDQIFKSEDRSLTEEFLNLLKEYLQARKTTRHQRMLEAINEDKPLSSFMIRSDVIDDFAIELLMQDIPFVLICNKTGEYGALVMSEEKPAIIGAVTNLLARKGNFMAVMTGEELFNLVQQYDEKNKALIALNGLTREQLRLLEKLCREKGELTEISEDLMEDGTYRFMAPARKTAIGANFARIIFEMFVMTEGYNAEVNEKRIQSEFAFDQLRYNNFGRDVIQNGRQGMNMDIYIVSSTNQYMKIMQTGFEYGRAALQNGQIVLIPDTELYMDTMGYYDYENSYLNRMTNPSATTNIHQVMDHMINVITGCPERDSLNYGYDQDEHLVHQTEMVMAKTIMKVVMRKVQNDSLMNIEGKEMQKIGHVTSEAGIVLQGLCNREIPRGYDELDFAEIIDAISSTAPGEFDINEYAGIAEKMADINITNEKGLIEITKDVAGQVMDIRSEYDLHIARDGVTEEQVQNIGEI